MTVSARPSLRLSIVALLTLSLAVACCPAPVSQSEASFAATVEAVAGDELRVRLRDGSLALLLGLETSGYSAGDRVYVEGTVVGSRVTVSRVTSIGRI